MVKAQELRLDNGLKIILKEVHTAPIISTWMWYRVGSRNEVEGHTGISHWVEHMMFKGSPRFPKGAIMRAIDRRGGYVNAMTASDFTAYFATVPSSAAELILSIEADRMTGALFDPTEVEAERTVVIAEREGSENEPQFLLAEELTAAAFRVHPYHHQTIGWKEDLKQISRDQLYAHYQRYYVPSNAVLVVVGDFQATEYLEMVQRYLGDLPAGDPPAQAVRQEPLQRGERRVTLRMPGSTPLLRLLYHTPPVSHADYIPLVLLDAVLSGGKAMFAFGDSPSRSARLYRALVETQLASSAGSSYHPSLDPYVLTLGATVREGRQPEEIEQALLAEIERLQEERIQEHELAVTIRQTQAQFAYSSESVTSQGLTLGFLDMVDHHQRMDSILDELAGVTPADVQRVARTYLTEDNRAVGWFLPTESGGADTGQGMDRNGYWTVLNRGMCGYAAQRAASMIGPDTVLHRRLDNCSTLLAKENPTSPSVAIVGTLSAGAVRNSEATSGLASMTASMLRRGTQRRTFQEINAALDDVGASLSFSAGLDSMSFAGQALTEDFDLLMDLLAEILQNPSFPETELEKLRGQLLTRLGLLEMDTGYRSDKAFMSTLYAPAHPYHYPSLGTRETVASFKREQLVDFYRAQYHPADLTISVVGAIPAERMLNKVAATLGSWQVPGDPIPLGIPPAETPAGILRKWENLPEKAQVDLIWGVVGMPRTAPDYYAAMMGNLVLGRIGLMGRLGDQVRDEQGLAYYVTSNLETGLGPHPWVIVAGVNPESIDQAVSSMLHEVERLRDEPIRDEELEDGRSHLIGALPLRLETNEGVARFLLAIKEYDLGLDYLQRYPAIIGAVTNEQIQHVARKYLTLDRYVLSMAGTFD